ncbi:MAG: hypothetical protein AAFY70_05315 [Bacteroidota bacterium]
MKRITFLNTHTQEIETFLTWNSLITSTSSLMSRLSFFIVSLIGFILVLFSFAQAQSGWTQAQNEGYFKLNQSSIRAGQFFNPDGNLIDITTTSVYSTVLYGEYGVNDRLTALVNAQLFVRGTINKLESTVDGTIIPGDEFNGLGEIQLGLKYGIVKEGPIVLSASGQVKLPSGANVGGETELLQTGDGAWGAIGMIHASHSFYPKPLYANLSAGYQWRGTADLAYTSGLVSVNYDDAFVWSGELGWLPNEHWVLAFKWTQVQPFGANSSEGVTGSSSIFGNRLTYFAIIPEVNYITSKNWGVSVSAGGVLSARNILAAPSFNVGIFYQLKLS